ncbi:MAG: SAM hydrolase/SAM-dependent halogenase family protein, partial [Candidatus Calescibacterium sp.]
MFKINIPIFFLTDYGTKDEYVGVVKSVILSINQDAKIIDITHEIPSQDIFSAAFIIDKILKYLPQKSIILAVVDPGVGGKRKPIVGESEIEFPKRVKKNIFFVGPDNGIFTPIFLQAKHYKVFEINAERILEEAKSYGLFLEKSNTFHGRDMFAPACALVSKNPEIIKEISLKEEVLPVKLELPKPQIKIIEYKEAEKEKSKETSKEKEKGKEIKEIIGHIIHIDKFGNLITNIPKEYLEGKRIKEIEILRVKLKEKKSQLGTNKSEKRIKVKAPLVSSYDSVKKGKP